jgi:hypothetical protein
MFPALPILDRLQDCWDRISKDQLAQLEADLGVSFPEDYRTFLLKFNAGYWSHRVRARVLHPTWCVHEFVPRYNLGIIPDEEFKYCDMRETVDDFSGRVPNSFLPIMLAEGSNPICMEMGKENSGKIYFWDRDHEGTDDNLVYLVADSFIEFLSCLTAESALETRREQLPIFQAVERGDREAVTTYLISGGEFDVRNERGWTLLMCAARNSWPRFVEMLLKVGADPNAVDPEGCTPMAHAVLGQSLDSIKLLLEFEARADYRDPRGRNLAQIAKDEHYHRIYYHLAPYMAYP